MSAVRVRPAEPGDIPRLVEIASHSATAAQWSPAEYLKLIAPDEPDIRPQAGPQVVNPKTVDPQVINPQTVNPQTVDPQTVDPKTVGPKVINPQTLDPQTVAPENRAQFRTALIVEQDGNVVGFIVGRQVEEEWEIENIAVTGAARRCGLGSRLVGELLDHVRSRGGKTVFLEVRESNRAARSLYEKWAFLEVGRRKMYYQNPAEDALVLKFKFP